MDQPTGYNPYALDSSGITAPPVSLFSALRKIGPGIILAGSIVGTGELLLTTSLGAKFGFAFLWLILFSCVVKVFVQIELGRYALSSGEPTLAALDKLPGLRFGAHWLVWWWFIMLMLTVAQLGAMCGGVGQALNLAFPSVTSNLANGVEGWLPDLANGLREQPEHPWAAVTAVVAILLLLSGGYKRIEHVTTFLVVAVTMITVGCVALLPAMGFDITLGDLEQGFSPSLTREVMATTGAIAAAFGAFGITGVGASELYAYPYWCLEKGYARFAGPQNDSPEWASRARGWMRVMYLDAWVSMIVFTVATVAFYTLGAVVLYRQELVPEKTQMIATLSEMYVPAFGEWTKLAFLIGAWAVLFKTLYVASASNSRLTADFLGLAKIVRYTNSEQRTTWIRRACVVYPLLGLAWYIWIGDPKTMTVLGGFAQAATLPVISGAAIFLRYRRLDQRLAPSRISDIFLWLAFLSITLVACYAIPQSIADLYK
jgi:manganese transport protein